jgi:hypothetical protein
MDLICPSPFCRTGTWRCQLPELVAANVSPWLKWGRDIVLRHTKREEDHGFVFMGTKTGEPLDAKRFSEDLMDAVHVACGVQGVGSQKLRRVFAAGSSPLVYRLTSTLFACAPSMHSHNMQPQRACHRVSQEASRGVGVEPPGKSHVDQQGAAGRGVLQARTPAEV